MAGRIDPKIWCPDDVVQKPGFTNKDDEDLPQVSPEMIAAGGFDCNKSNTIICFFDIIF